MSRRRGGRPLHGWIVIDKPEGMSSAGAVAAVRRVTGATKAGHGGTLDPLATGVLPVALGEATKTVDYVMAGAKSYSFRVAWGAETSTDDREGEITATSGIRPDAAAIDAALARFRGEIEQRPPAYSALKVAGERAYALARRGDAPDLAPRLVHVERFALLAADADGADFEVTCGKGTYIRALARDLARALGTAGHVARLRRTACGPFRQNQAISLDNLGEFGHSAAPASFVLPVTTALDDIPALAVAEDEAHRLANGQPVPYPSGVLFDAMVASPPGAVLQALCAGRLVALVRAGDGFIRAARVFNF